MIKAEIDITEPMELFSKFSEQDDINHAMEAVMIVAARASLTPREVLSQIKVNASRARFNDDYRMACKILELLDRERSRYKRKSEMINDSVDDAIFGLNEIKKSGNPAVIKGFIDAVKLDLKQIESVL